MLAGLLATTLALTPAFGEAPLRPLGNDDVAPYCLQATGAPGEVAIRSKTGVQLLEATRAGFQPRGEIELGDVLGCPASAARANGARVAAATTYESLVAAVRDPGGGPGTDAVLATESSAAWRVDDVQVAVADTGDAVVAWTERNELEDRSRIFVARRAPGQPFASAEAVLAEQSGEVAVWTGVAATGETFVMTASVESARPPVRVPVRVAIAPRGGPWAPPAAVGHVRWRSHPDLAVAPDGRALVAIPDGAALLVAERLPGAAFAPPVNVGATDDAIAVRADVALGAQGEAAVAWAGYLQEGVALASRRGPGPFSPLVTVEPSARLSGDPFYRSETFGWLADRTFAFGGREAESLALTADGHVLLARANMAEDADGVSQTTAHLAKLPLGGDRVETGAFGGALGIAASVTPIELADGTPGLAWSERAETFGTLRLAAPGATAPADPAPPTVRLGAPADRVLGEDDRLVLPVRCGGPCELRAQVLGDSGAYARLRLSRAGRGRLKFEDGSGPIAPRRLGPVRIRLTYGRPDAQRPRARTFSVRLVRAPERPAPPPPRVEGVRAVRRGGAIEVTWRVRRPRGIGVFYVSGAAIPDPGGEPITAARALASKPKRTFRVTLKRTEGVRWVTVRDALQDTRTTVRVR